MDNENNIENSLIEIPFVPYICDLVKASTKEDFMIEMLATPNSIDTEGDHITPEMIDDRYLMEKGWITWRHTQGDRYTQTSPLHYIGKPVSSERKKEGYFVKAKLDKGNKYAVQIWEDLTKGEFPDKYGSSIEGSKSVHPYTRKITKACVRNVAIDPNPVHPGTYVQIAKAMRADAIRGHLAHEKLSNEVNLLVERMGKLEKSTIKTECTHIDKNGHIKIDEIYNHARTCRGMSMEKAVLLQAKIIKSIKN